MLKLHAFFANTSGSGYSLIETTPIPAPLHSYLSNITLPILKDKERVCIAYSAMFFQKDQFVFSLMTWWPALKDQYERPGLVFVHHVICMVTPEDRLSDLIQLAIGLVEGYGKFQEVIGEKVALLAMGHSELGWERELISLSEVAYSKDAIDYMSVIFGEWYNRENPEKINLYIDFPFRSVSVIPCLLTILRHFPVRAQVAGGQLEPNHLADYQAISISEEAAFFKFVKLRNIFITPEITQTVVEIQQKSEKRSKNQKAVKAKRTDKTPGILSGFWRFWGLDSNTDQDTDQSAGSEEEKKQDAKHSEERFVEYDESQLKTLISHHQALLTELESYYKRVYGKK